MAERKEKVSNLIKELAARFLSKESNRTSLVTVTDCHASSDLKRATIFITVLPASKEKSALDFTKRKRAEFRDFLKKNMKSKLIPFIDFEIDTGEKNRQKIDELLREK
ncbi:MAG TPA: ribosome-binding factor A [Candidatus Paceibacterota bacterium]|nr:ribosome-binding factor A [Candidatus Paceibacterota bacterium]